MIETCSTPSTAQRSPASTEHDRLLHTRGAQLVVVDPALREQILDRLTDPNLALYSC